MFVKQRPRVSKRAPCTGGAGWAGTVVCGEAAEAGEGGAGAGGAGGQGLCCGASAFAIGPKAAAGRQRAQCVPGRNRSSWGTRSWLHKEPCIDLLSGKGLKSPGTDGLNRDLLAEVLGEVHSFPFPLAASD